ncbi:hypothetical protein P8H26_07930 [Pseudochrobactrum sp. sp1633]|uniref:hypothetical protein n=1 Tax=Pseudochrobactrum sp. sp1633 TaxID=3036706 RepID=UPI0025A4D0E1|nr:hypothetical protein [Pseudochrobactrum sp. sp1633]MDM8345322.1 hypothetical protein [Pseudochrobactrum sp. sp1633]HWD12827.1 hypothetical protein [Pseudochrobactrum sp.]
MGAFIAADIAHFSNNFAGRRVLAAMEFKQKNTATSFMLMTVFLKVAEINFQREICGIQAS